MTPSAARPLDAVCLPYHGKPEKTPLWDEWRPWPYNAAAGHSWTDDLEEARIELHRQGYIPQVKRSRKADLVRLSLRVGKHERLVLK